MRKLWLALALSLGLAPAQAQNAGWPPPAGAQAFLCVYNLVQPTVTTGQIPFAQCDANGNLRVTGSFSATTEATATAAAPSYSEGTSNPISQDLSGYLRVLDKNSAALLSAVQGAIPAGTNAIGSVINIPTATAGNALTTVTCGSAVSSCVLKASAGNFYGAYANCTAACWLMVFNATSAPSNGATTAGSSSGNLVECIDIAAASSKSLTYPTFPRVFTVGITAAISSTACATLTLATTGFVSGSVQ